MMNDPELLREVLNWPRATNASAGTGWLRAVPADFQVDEELGFAPDGSGEHVYLHIRKTSTNTHWLAKQIAEVAGVELLDVGYCGLKDRRAVTTQWFSVYLPGNNRPDPNWRALENEQVQILDFNRHSHKLRRGMHKANHFIIRLRKMEVDRQQMEANLSRCAEQGVPNYFGGQRFGHEGGNLSAALDMLLARKKPKQKFKRGLYLSVARSFVFNTVLAQRVEAGNWLDILDGDLTHPSANPSLESLEFLSPDSATGPLWGRGRSLVSGETLALEEAALSHLADLLGAMEHVGLNQARRSLALKALDLSWEWVNPVSLQLRFTLPPGAYATAVLRELCDCREPDIQAWMARRGNQEGDAGQQGPDETPAGGRDGLGLRLLADRAGLDGDDLSAYLDTD